MWVISNIRQYLENVRTQRLLKERYRLLALERKVRESWYRHMKLPGSE